MRLSIYCRKAKFWSRQSPTQGEQNLRRLYALDRVSYAYESFCLMWRCREIAAKRGAAKCAQDRASTGASEIALSSFWGYASILPLSGGGCAPCDRRTEQMR
jgi:hypothetical protein